MPLPLFPDSSLNNCLKYKLFDLGLFNQIDTIRRISEIADYITGGCAGSAPPPVKRMVLSAYLHRFKLKQFIETGTYLGDTLAYIAHDKTIMCTSIELSDDFFSKAKARFASYSNVSLLHGDSGMVLPKVVQTLQEPALFWLDGHYSGGGTGKGDKDTPINLELAAILNSPIKKHVVLIDDARYFDGQNGYPYIGKLLQIVSESLDYEIEVSTDIIRLIPK